MHLNLGAWMTDKEEQFSVRNYEARLSRLETVMDSVQITLTKIEEKLTTSARINWQPIALAATLIITLGGAVNTIYSSRIEDNRVQIEQLLVRQTSTEHDLAETRTELKVRREYEEKFDAMRDEKIEEITQGK